MPSSPGSANARPALPWFLDALRWIRWLSDAPDRDLIEVVRLDLTHDLDELLEAGVPRWTAYRTVWRRTRLECGVFMPRAVRAWKRRTMAGFSSTKGRLRRVARPALSVAAIGVVLLSAKWFIFDRTSLDELAKVSARLIELRNQLEEARAGLVQLGGQNATGGASLPVSQEARDLMDRLGAIQEYFEKVQQDHPREFQLAGLIGLVDEELAVFWEVRGEDAKATLHWTAALQSYGRGVLEGDPISLYHLGGWTLDRGNLEDGVAYLEAAERRWPQLAIAGGDRIGHVAAYYQWGLLELWKARRNPLLAVEARRVEEEALRDVRQGTTKELTYHVLYNAACMRVSMVRAGALDPIEAWHAIELLRLALDTSGDQAPEIAEAVLTDPDLEGLRDTPAFRGIASRATELLESVQPERKPKAK